jgi:peptide/nickel transport system permease protein
MFDYIVRRLFQFIPTFFGATLLAFVVIQLAPGDFVSRLALDPSLERGQVERLRQQFGLDQPITVQYVKWLSSVAQGYLGVSLSYQTDVWSVLRPRIVNSLVLVGLAVVLIHAVAIPVGVYSALRQYQPADKILTSLAFVGLAIPNFFFAILMLYFALWLRDWTGANVFPLGGMRSQMIDGVPFSQAPLYKQWLNILWHAVLPVIVTATAGMAGVVRVMRGQMLEQLSADYVRTANAKGLRGAVVVYKHALRNAVIPIIAGIGFILPSLVSGAGLVEVVMAWPGVTPLLLDAIFSRDLYVIMGVITITTVLLIIGNLISDILLAWVDPRIRYS